VFIFFEMMVGLVFPVFGCVIFIKKLNGTSEISFFSVHHLEKWWKLTNFVMWQFDVKKLQKSCKIWHFLKNRFFGFLMISPVIFEIQKRTIPQIKAKNKLIGHYFIIFIATSDIFWTLMWWKCIIFFSSDFISKFQYKIWTYVLTKENHWKSKLEEIFYIIRNCDIKGLLRYEG